MYIDAGCSAAAPECIVNAARWHAKQDHIYQPIAFTHDGKRLIGGYSKFKVAFDEVMLAELRKIDRKAKLQDAWFTTGDGRLAASGAGLAFRTACRNGIGARSGRRRGRL